MGHPVTVGPHRAPCRRDPAHLLPSVPDYFLEEEGVEGFSVQPLQAVFGFGDQERASGSFRTPTSLPFNTRYHARRVFWAPKVAEPVCECIVYASHASLRAPPSKCACVYLHVR